jgi:paraquat-inducible protein A
MNNSIITCPICGLLQRLESLPRGAVAACSRCNSRVARSGQNSLERTAAFSLAALVLYVPANIYPILSMDFHGLFTESTVWDGCVRLFQDGQWIVAVIAFLASLLVPLFKLFGLFFLVVTTWLKVRRFQYARTRFFKIIEVIGPWAMLDVLLLAVLVPLVKLGRVATATPGPGLLAFALVVVLTMLASASFDPRQIWEERKPNP